MSGRKAQNQMTNKCGKLSLKEDYDLLAGVNGVWTMKEGLVSNWTQI